MSDVNRSGGHSMAASLRRVLVCRPDTAQWSSGSSWKELGYFRPPAIAEASVQHDGLVAALRDAGVDVLELPDDPALSLDAVYAHDASFPTDRGMILMHMGKASRRGESDVHGRFFESHHVPVLGRIEPPALSEGGDMVWLDQNTLLIGEGYRTNAAGIAQVRALLEPDEVDVVSAPLPHGPGPEACLHLMSLVSILDARVALVDLPWLGVPTIELLRSKGFELIPIEEGERDTLACNVLALGGKRLLAIEENEATNRRLVGAGFDVLTYRGSEISLNGSGGPTCLTRPILRG